jgi:hypothetical protein
MTITKKLISIIFVYLAASMALGVLYHEYQNPGWLMRHVQWSYIVWSLRGPLSAVAYAWHGLAPIWQHLSTFLAGGPVVVCFLSSSVLFKGKVSARRCWLGLVVWLALAAGFLGPRTSRLRSIA